MTEPDNNTMITYLRKTLLISALVALCSATYGQGLGELSFGPQKEQSGRRIDGVAAIVGNDIITVKELKAAGNDNKALNRLIMQKLLMQAAETRNISVGDTALNIAMQEAKAKGKAVSREQLRRNLIIQQLQNRVANSLVSISDAEVANAVEKKLQQSDAQIQLVDILVRVPESADAKTLQNAKEKTQRILAALKTQPPHAVAKSFNVIYNDLGWVELSKIPASFAKPLLDAPNDVFLDPIIDKDGIHLLKVTGRKSATESGGEAVVETRVSHILIRDKDNPNAKARIDDIYRQLQAGGDFSALAEQYSEDPGSATNGGSLDWASPGQMVPDFESMMNKTAIGQISQPFQSPFGYHILKVHERRQAQTGNRKALEKSVRKAIFQKRASEEWELWLSQLRDEAHIEIIK